MLTRLVVCALMGGARLAEVAWSRRNLAESGATVEGPRSRGTFPLIAAVHTAVIAGTAFWGGRPRWPFLLLLAAVQPIRVWVLVTLGKRWNVRAAVPEEMDIATTGPYAYVRHPNYTVVAVELGALPLGFGLPRLALAATAVNAALLAARIPEEERALHRLPGWGAHFSDKKRFIPGLW